MMQPNRLPSASNGDRFAGRGVATCDEPLDSPDADDALDPLAQLREALNRAMPGERVRHAMAALAEIAEIAERTEVEARAATPASADAGRLWFVAQSAHVLRGLLREATPESRPLVAHAVQRVERFARWSASVVEPGRTTTLALCEELVARLSPRRERVGGRDDVRPRYTRRPPGERLLAPGVSTGRWQLGGANRRW
jgi:hypothetical protein